MSVLYANDNDVYIADDVDDLRAAWEEHTGDNWDDFGDAAAWHVVDPEATLSIWCDESGAPTEPEADGAAIVTKTATEWAAERPRGMLCSEDY